MRSRTFEKLGNMTRRQTATAEGVTQGIAEDVLKRDLSGDGGHMDLELRPAGNTFGEDAVRVVEIRRAHLRYRVEIYVKREA